MEVRDLLYDMFLSAKREYEEVLKRGDVETAKKKAYQCANYLSELAKHEPNKRQFYQEKAREWIETAKKLERGEIKPVARLRNKSTEAGRKVANAQESSEFKKYVESLITKTNVTWDDIGGLEEVKRLLKINYVLAAVNKPETIKPWQGILLFGPPGTGKTLLASALAGSLNATFFSVSASKVLSKYFGESSKIITALYEVAREKAPSVIFIDEIDSLALKRTGEVSEASRRVLATLLAEMDGLQEKKSDKTILTLAATNTPWNLDEAILSRFQVRIYVPLPDEEATKQILKIHLKGLDTSKLDWDSIAKECVSRLYSGRDLKTLAQKVIWNMILRENPNLDRLAERPVEELRKMFLKMGPILMKDFEEAFKKVKSPLTRAEIERYEEWAEEFGTRL